MNLSWNKSSSDLAPYWNRWCEELPLIKEAALRWRDHLVSLRSLADNLLRFVKMQNLTLFLQENFWSKTDRFSFRRSSVDQS